MTLSFTKSNLKCSKFSYDVLLLGNSDQILKQFKMSGAKVFFGAEGFCWPDEKLANDYPEVLRGKRYLNSGGT